MSEHPSKNPENNKRKHQSTAKDADFKFAEMDDSPFDGFGSMNASEQPVRSENNEAKSTQMVPAELLDLQSRLVSLGMCSDRQWMAAIKLATDPDDTHDVLDALFAIQNGNSSAHWYVLTHYQLQRIKEGRLDALLMGHWLILDEVNTDRTGVLYHVWNRNLARVECLKTFVLAEIPSESANDREERLRTALDRIEAVAQLNHHHIIKIYHAGEQDGVPFVVTEHVEGKTLRTVVDESQKFGKPLDLSWVARATCEIAEALGQAQKLGVAHQELTAQNLLVTEKGEIKIVNLGLCSLFNQTHSSPDTLNREQRSVLAPESWLRPDVVSLPADIYALGCLFFQMLTGKVPYDGQTIDKLMSAHLHDRPPRLTDHRRDVPRKLNGLLNRMLAKLPGDRPNCSSIVEELTPYCSGADRTRLLSQSLFRSASGWVMVVLATAIVLPAILLAFSSSRRNSPPAPSLNASNDRLLAGLLEKNSDVWAGLAPLKEFANRNAEDRRKDQTLEELVNAESWRRRWLLSLANFQQKHKDVWPGPDDLVRELQPFDANITSREEYQSRLAEVERVTTSRYVDLWNKFLNEAVAAHPKWADADQLRGDLEIPDSSIVDGDSLRLAREKLVELTKTQLSPFRNDAFEDTSENNVTNAARTYRWMMGLPESLKKDDVVDVRTVVDNQPTDKLIIDQRAELQIRCNITGFATVVIFQSTGRQLLAQAPVVAGDWQPLLVVVPYCQGTHQVLVCLSDSAAHKSESFEDLSTNRFGELLVFELDPPQVKQLKERFTSPAVYSRTVSSMRRGEITCPSLPPSPAGWFATRTISLHCE